MWAIFKDKVGQEGRGAATFCSLHPQGEKLAREALLSVDSKAERGMAV